MPRYQINYVSPIDRSLQCAILENDQEFVDTMEILDKNDAPYDPYIIRSDNSIEYLYDYDERNSK